MLLYSLPLTLFTKMKPLGSKQKSLGNKKSSGHSLKKTFEGKSTQNISNSSWIGAASWKVFLMPALCHVWQKEERRGQNS